MESLRVSLLRRLSKPSEMGGRFFQGFNILFLAARIERHAGMSCGTTSPLWRSGTHNAASPFAVSAAGMWGCDVGAWFSSSNPQGDGKGHCWVHFYIFIARSANVIAKDGRPFLAIKLKWKRKFFHFLCALFIFSSIFPFITLVTKTSLTVFLDVFFF